jgi:hypothetical protein
MKICNFDLKKAILLKEKNYQANISDQKDRNIKIFKKDFAMANIGESHLNSEKIVKFKEDKYIALV